MTELQDIQAWLNSPRDFDAGFMLYIAYFNDKDTRFVLERHRNAAKLFNIMRERFYELKNANARECKTNTPVIKVNGKELTGDFNLPEEYLTRWGELKTEQERWHTEMCLIGEGKTSLTQSQMKQRAQLARMIIAHEDVLYQLGSAINHYREHGAVPEGFKLHQPVPRKKKAKSISKLTETEKVLKLKNSINPNLSKLKKKIEEKKKLIAGLKGKDLERANKKLTEWEEEEKQLLEEKNEILNAQQ